MNLIKKHEISSFYIGTYTLTGLLFLLQSLIFRGHILGYYLLSPAIAALIMVGITSKKDGILSFLEGFIPKKTEIKWMLLALIIPSLLLLLADCISRLLANQSLQYGKSANPLNLGIIVALIIGCIGEELGWRGYLLPLLSKRYNRILSSIFVGLFWGFWHTNKYGEGLGFFLFVASTVCISIIMTWLYYKGGQSLLTAILFHSMFNICANYIGSNPSILYKTITVVVIGVPAIILIFTSSIFKGNLSVSKCENDSI